jgi:hypothetical protein
LQKDVNPLTVRLTNALERGDKLEMNVALRVYKMPNGAVNYNQVLRVPSTDRIHGLISSGGYERVHRMLSGAVQVAMESLNINKTLSANQIIDLVDALIDSSREDNLAVEDIVLFLQKLVRGEAGKLFNSIDIPRFMEYFEDYRQQRHSEYLRAKEEIHAQHKATGTLGRSTSIEKDKDMDINTFFDLLQTVNMKDETEQSDSH